ncbi:MAG: FtsX-like permease family protein, partial [Ilumatobacteraceae bacterium]
MFRLSLRNVWARKGRLMLTALAIIAGTAFLSGVFVFSDTIRGSFDTLFANAYAKTDAYVRSSNKIEGDFGNTIRDGIPDTLVGTVRAVPGVKYATGDVTGFARLSTTSGKEIGTSGPPAFGSVYTGSPTSPWSLSEGNPPNGPNEVVIDKHSAKLGSLHTGDQVKVTTAVGVETVTVVGIARFAGSDTTGGATWALFDLPTAQKYVTGKPGQVDAIIVGGDGTMSQQQLADRVETAIGQPDVEVLTGKQIIAENQTAVERGLSFVKLFLTIFALISLFVGSFIIFNVFSISAAQRQKENALLRAIGASRSQVTRSLFAEALVVGVGGSLLGFVGGVGLALGIMKLLTAGGFGPGTSSLVIQPNAFVITVVVGIVVTLLCAIVPALRAGRVSPLAAMRDMEVDRTDLSRGRVITGIAFLVGAAAAIAGGLAGTTWLLGLGTVGLFISLIALGPLVAGPVARLLTGPLRRMRGVVGAVAGRNASRNPKRIALTAGALGVGLALLVGVATLGSSAKSSIRDAIGAQFVGDYTVSTTDSGFGGLPTSLADKLGELPEVSNATGLGGTLINVLGSDSKPHAKLVLVLNPASAQGTIALPFVSGGWQQLEDNGLLVSKSTAESQHYVVGSTVDVSFLDGTTKVVTVRGVFDSRGFGNYIVDRNLFKGTPNQVFDRQILVTRKPGVSDAAATAAITAVADGYPTAKVETRSEFIDAQSSQVDTFLNFVYALLGMSIFIAVLGIVITLLLSVYERRRELGLMRAVGATRSQIRGSVRWEAVITAVIGAVMGVGLGLALGWIVVRALRDQGLSTFAVPTMSIVVFTV